MSYNSQPATFAAPPQRAAEGTGNLTPPGGKVSTFLVGDFPSLRERPNQEQTSGLEQSVLSFIEKLVSLILVVTAMLYVILGFQFRI